METTRSGVKCIIKMLSLCVAALCAMPLSAQQLMLDGPDSPSREGYFTVSISTPGQPEMSLQNLRVETSLSKNFATVEQTFPALGDFKQLSLTGFSDGTYFLRARADNIAEPSAPIKVVVDHYPLWQALSLFGCGLVLFVLLVTVLLRAHSRTEAGEQHD